MLAGLRDQGECRWHTSLDLGLVAVDHSENQTLCSTENPAEAPEVGMQLGGVVVGAPRAHGTHDFVPGQPGPVVGGGKQRGVLEIPQEKSAWVGLVKCPQDSQLLFPLEKT